MTKSFRSYLVSYFSAVDLVHALRGHECSEFRNISYVLQQNVRRRPQLTYTERPGLHDERRQVTFSSQRISYRSMLNACVV